MINLLPTDTKQTLVFARRNTLLVRSAIGLGIGLAFLLIVIGGSYIALQQQVDSYEEAIATSEATLSSQKETETIARVQEISNSLTLVVDVLGDEVLFSKLLRQVGAAMPSGTILQNLSLSSELSGAIDLQAGAADHTSASQVQVNLADPTNRIFEKADIISITCGNQEENSAYPCTVSLRAQFSDDNDFKLLSENLGGDQ